MTFISKQKQMFTKLLDGIFVLVFSILKRHHRKERPEKYLKHMFIMTVALISFIVQNKKLNKKIFLRKKNYYICIIY